MIVSVMILCLLVALVVGFLFGWFLKKAYTDEMHQDEIVKLTQQREIQEELYHSLHAKYKELIGEIDETSHLLQNNEEIKVSLEEELSAKTDELDTLQKVLKEIESTELDMSEKVVLETREYDELLEELTQFKSSVKDLDLHTKVYEVSDRPAIFTLVKTLFKK